MLKEAGKTPAEAREDAHVGRPIGERRRFAEACRKGMMIAGKAMVFATIGVMSIGMTGCGHKSTYAPDQQVRIQQNDTANMVRFKLREARLSSRHMRDNVGLPPAIQGTQTTNDKGDPVPVEVRWWQLMYEAGKGNVMDGDRLDKISRELQNLEHHMGDKKVKELMGQFDKKSRHPKYQK